MQRLSLALCLAIFSLVVGCGGSSETKTTKVVEVGGKEVTIPSNTPENVFAVTKAQLATSAYEPWYQHCILGQIERQFTRAEAEEMTRAPKAEREQREIASFEKAESNCLQPGRTALNPNATPAQVAPVRDSTAVLLERTIKSEGASSKDTACVGKAVKELSDAEVLELGNAAEHRQLAITREILKPCFR